MLPSPVITASQGGVTRETSAEAPATYVPMEEVGHAHVKVSALAPPALQHLAGAALRAERAAVGARVERRAV